ncbi:unnamed protein product [Urochloa humidicola]
MGWNRLTCRLQESKAQSEQASLSDPGHICTLTLPKLQWPVQCDLDHLPFCNVELTQTRAHGTSSPCGRRMPLRTGYRPTPSRHAAPTGHRRLSEFTAMARFAISLHHPEGNV